MLAAEAASGAAAWNSRGIEPMSRPKTYADFSRGDLLRISRRAPLSSRPDGSGLSSRCGGRFRCRLPRFRLAGLLSASLCRDPPSRAARAWISGRSSPGPRRSRVPLPGAAGGAAYDASTRGLLASLPGRHRLAAPLRPDGSGAVSGPISTAISSRGIPGGLSGSRAAQNHSTVASSWRLVWLAGVRRSNSRAMDRFWSPSAAVASIGKRSWPSWKGT